MTKKSNTNSTPVLGTIKKSRNSKGFTNNETLAKKAATVFATTREMIGKRREPQYDLAPNGIPVHPILPELKIPDPKSKDQRQYIKFYVWDAVLQEHVPLKDYDVNDVPKEKRDEFVKQRIADLTSDIRAGYHRNKLKVAEIKKGSVSQEKLIAKLIPALDEELESKRIYREKTYDNYKYHINKFKNWVSNKHRGLLCAELDNDIAVKFMEYLSDEGLGRRSLNNFKSYLTTVWYDLQARGFFDKKADNPFSSLVKMKTGMGKNIAFRPEQQKEIFDFLTKKNKYRQRLLSMFVYYTLLRTNELAQLQIFEIDTYRKDYIYLPKEKSKNSHERWIKIGPDLRKIINSLELDKYPSNWYVWGKYLMPNESEYGSSKIGDMYGRTVLRPIKYDVHTYSLYCWKHTGVVAAKRSGVADADIILQGGWLDIKSYNTYLKSLGLFAETDYDTKVPSILHL